MFAIQVRRRRPSQEEKGGVRPKKRRRRTREEAKRQSRRGGDDLLVLPFLSLFPSPLPLSQQCCAALSAAARHHRSPHTHTPEERQSERSCGALRCALPLVCQKRTLVRPARSKSSCRYRQRPFSRRLPGSAPGRCSTIPASQGRRPPSPFPPFVVLSLSLSLKREPLALFLYYVIHLTSRPFVPPARPSLGRSAWRIPRGSSTMSPTRRTRAWT